MEGILGGVDLNYALILIKAVHMSAHQEHFDTIEKLEQEARDKIKNLDKDIVKEINRLERENENLKKKLNGLKANN